MSVPLTLQDVREAAAMVCETVGQRWHGTQLEDACDECASAIRAMELPPTGWQPIETGPRDRWILLYQGHVDIAEHDRIHIAMHDRVGDPPGWFADGGVEIEVPTHWMPLPAPPETAP